MTIRVVDPGLLTTVQDGGRWGHQTLGVSVAGPMDGVSHRCANLVVGNFRETMRETDSIPAIPNTGLRIKNRSNSFHMSILRTYVKVTNRKACKSAPNRLSRMPALSMRRTANGRINRRSELMSKKMTGITRWMTMIQRL